MSEIADIYNTRDELFVIFTKKKVNFRFIFSVMGKHLTFLLVISRWLSACSGYSIGCKRSLHLENGLLYNSN